MRVLLKLLIGTAFLYRAAVATNIYAEYDERTQQMTVDFRSLSIKALLSITPERTEKLQKSQGRLDPIALDITEDKSKEDVLKEFDTVLQKVRANSYQPRSLMFQGINTRKSLSIADKFIEAILKVLQAESSNTLSILYEDSAFLLKKELMPSLVSIHSERFPEKNRATSPRIVIPIRGTSDDKDGKGTFYDHFVLQKITFSPTAMLLPPPTPAEEILCHLRSYAQKLPYGLLHGDVEPGSDKMLPEVQRTSSFEEGLLVIPGRMRDREENQVRKNHEEAILRQALLRGQPILGLCAGSWRLWQALWIRDGFTGQYLKTVTDHSASRMMSLSETKPKVGYNSMMHGLQWDKASLLYDFLTYKNSGNFMAPPDDMQVNSVHWKAPQLCTINAQQKLSPFGIAVGATSKNTKQLNNKNRNNHVMQPEEGVIEAFSSCYGAPVIGISWHPEASNEKV